MSLGVAALFHAGETMDQKNYGADFVRVIAFPAAPVNSSLGQERN